MPKSIKAKEATINVGGGVTMGIGAFIENDPHFKTLLESRLKGGVDTVWPENDPEPGFTWNKCLCRQIDPTDRPCCACSGRWTDAVPLLVIHLDKGTVDDIAPAAVRGRG